MAGKKRLAVQDEVKAPKRKAKKAVETGDLFSPVAVAAKRHTEAKASPPRPRASPPAPVVAASLDIELSALKPVLNDLAGLKPTHVRLSSPGQNQLALDVATSSGRARIVARWSVVGMLAAPWVGEFDAVRSFFARAKGRKGDLATLQVNAGKLTIRHGRHSRTLEGSAVQWSDALTAGKASQRSGAVQLTSLDVEWPFAYAVQPTVTGTYSQAGQLAIRGAKLAGANVAGDRVHFATITSSPYGATEAASLPADW